MSADVYALDLVQASGERQTVVLRQHRIAEWKPHEANVASMEFGVLQALHSTAMPVPEPLMLDTTGQLLPRPFFVMEFVEGSTEVTARHLDASLEVMASVLVQLHQFPSDGLDMIPSRTDPLPELFDYLPKDKQWRVLRDHLTGVADTAFTDRPALLHGDFWPGNLLWREGKLVAILDWEDAALGDPLSDVAGARLELLWKYGAAAMDHFTSLYATALQASPLHGSPLHGSPQHGSPQQPRTPQVKGLKANALNRELTLKSSRLALWDVFVGAAALYFMGEWGLEPSREADMRSKALDFIGRARHELLAT